jgi:hypothetical protein
MRFSIGRSVQNPERIITIRCMAAALGLAALSVWLIYGFA